VRTFNSKIESIPTSEITKSIPRFGDKFKKFSVNEEKYIVMEGGSYLQET
jgi:hypothetical protein